MELTWSLRREPGVLLWFSVGVPSFAFMSGTEVRAGTRAVSTKPEESARRRARTKARSIGRPGLQAEIQTICGVTFANHRAGVVMPISVPVNRVVGPLRPDRGSGLCDCAIPSQLAVCPGCPIPCDAQDLEDGWRGCGLLLWRCRLEARVLALAPVVHVCRRSLSRRAIRTDASGVLSARRGHGRRRGRC